MIRYTSIADIAPGASASIACFAPEDPTLHLSDLSPAASTPEAHAIITLDPAQRSPQAAAATIASAAARLSEQMRAEGMRPVMARWMVSDAAAMAEAVAEVSAGIWPAARSDDDAVAVALTGQTPLRADGSAARAAMWVYFMPSDVVDHHADLSPLTPPFAAAVSRPGGVTHLFAASMTAAGADSREQTYELLQSFAEGLRGRGASLGCAALRTWFMVRDIDRHYAGVVAGRNELFAAEGLTPPRRFIASTGIQGIPPRAEVAATLDAWAAIGLRPGQMSYPEALTHLGPTSDYGVAFERATAVDYADRRHLIVSGTASIDRSGAIVAPGDIEGQTARMADNVGALLAAASMSWTDVAHLIIYLRDPADAAAVDGVIAARLAAEGAAGIPRIMVHAPVCRPGWLVEMECMAVAPASNPSFPPF